MSGLDSRNTQRVLIAASAAQNNQTFNRNQVGWTTRANFGFDFASNTAYGPLIGHFDINSEAGNGFDNVNNTYLNTGYLTWAGITAGKAQSFYSFVGGGDNWANFASPDQKGFNEPTCSPTRPRSAAGFTATIAAQSQGTNGQNGASGGGTNMYRRRSCSAGRNGQTSSAPCMSSRAGARRRSQASFTTSTSRTTPTMSLRST